MSRWRQYERLRVVHSGAAAVSLRAAVLALVAAVGLLHGLPQQALAQSREGGWIGFSARVGPTRSSFGDRQPLSETVGVSHFDFGGWARRRWMIGIEVGGASDMAPGSLPSTIIPVTLLGTVAYDPSLSHGFYVKGGGGALWATMDIVDEFGTTANATIGTGGIYIVGTGWDLHLGRRFWLTPAVNLRYGYPGDLVLSGRTRVATGVTAPWTSRSA